MDAFGGIRIENSTKMKQIQRRCCNLGTLFTLWHGVLTLRCESSATHTHA